MFTAIYEKTPDGRAVFDILATRDADITEATAAMGPVTSGPGGLRLLAAVRAGHLLQTAADRIRRAPANTADWFAYNSPDLGSVTVAWVD